MRFRRTRSERVWRGASFVKQCKAMYGDVWRCRAMRAANIEQKKDKKNIKGAQKKDGDKLIVGGQNFKRASIAML